MNKRRVGIAGGIEALLAAAKSSTTWLPARLVATKAIDPRIWESRRCYGFGQWQPALPADRARGRSVPTRQFAHYSIERF